MGNEKILICDDSILARQQLKNIAKRCSSLPTFVEAANGQEAIDAYKLHQPQLVFMDIVMPVNDGVEAIREIRRFDPKAYIVVVSSVGTQTQLKNAILEGARDFVQKPYTFSAIAEILKGRFEGR